MGTHLKSISIFSVLIVIVMILSACSSGQNNSPTPLKADATNTFTDVLTETSLPSSTPTLTLAERPIDLEKYHTLPASYEYLEEHTEEFIQVPDPATEREAFDQWFSEQLVPVIGPRQDRVVNLQVSALGQGAGMYSAWPEKKSPLIENPGFFYFEHSGIIFPVLVINVSRSDPEVVDQTFCVGLLGGSWAPMPSVGDALLLLSKGGGVTQIDLFSSTSVELISGVQLDPISSDLVNTVGDTWFNYPDNIAFGIGQVVVRE